MSRIEDELALLRQFFSVEYVPAGNWFKVPAYPIRREGWNPSVIDVAFQALPTYPGAPPYGFFVPIGLRFNGSTRQNFQEPAPSPPPFEGKWALFSWTPEPGQWRPGSTVYSGSNLSDWVRGFAQRFAEGA